MTHICVRKLTTIVSDNGLSLGRRQAIIWTNVGILLTGRLGINFTEILVAIHTFSLKKMHFKISSEKWRPFCLGLNVLTSHYIMLLIHAQPITANSNGIGKVYTRLSYECLIPTMGFPIRVRWHLSNRSAPDLSRNGRRSHRGRLESGPVR